MLLWWRKHWFWPYAAFCILGTAWLVGFPFWAESATAQFPTVLPWVSQTMKTPCAGHLFGVQVAHIDDWGNQRGAYLCRDFFGRKWVLVN